MMKVSVVVLINRTIRRKKKVRRKTKKTKAICCLVSLFRVENASSVFSQHDKLDFKTTTTFFFATWWMDSKNNFNYVGVGCFAGVLFTWVWPTKKHNINVDAIFSLSTVKKVHISRQMKQFYSIKHRCFVFEGHQSLLVFYLEKHKISFSEYFY